MHCTAVVHHFLFFFPQTFRSFLDTNESISLPFEATATYQNDFFEPVSTRTPKMFFFI